MRHVDEGGAQALVQSDELGAHLGAQLGVEVGERLVHEEDLGLLDHGAGKGHALALASRELRGLSVKVLLEADDVGELLDAPVSLRLGDLGVDEAELHVLSNGHGGVEGVVLEDHGDVALAGLGVVHADAVDEEVAGADFLQAGNHAQRRCLAAAGRANEHGEATVLDGEVHVLYDRRLVLVGLAHMS